MCFGRGNLDELFFARPGAHHPAQIFESTNGDNKTTIFLEKNAAPDVGEKLQVQMAANFGGHIFCDDRRRASHQPTSPSRGEPDLMVSPSRGEPVSW